MAAQMRTRIKATVKLGHAVMVASLCLLNLVPHLVLQPLCITSITVLIGGVPLVVISGRWIGGHI